MDLLSDCDDLDEEDPSSSDFFFADAAAVVGFWLRHAAVLDSAVAGPETGTDADTLGGSCACDDGGALNETCLAVAAVDMK